MGAARLPGDEQGSPSCSGAFPEVQQETEGSWPTHMYLVSERWWSAWEAYNKQERDGRFGALPHPGPIDNSSLLEESAGGAAGEPVLKEGLKEGIDYRVLSQEHWDRLQAVNGGGVSIRRPVVSASNGLGGPAAEVYKMSVTVLADTGDKQMQRTDVTISTDTTMEELKELACKDLDLPGDNMHVWDYYNRDKLKTLDDCMDKSLADCNILDGQAILLEGTSSTGAQGGSESDSSETNLLSPTNDVTSSFAPMSLANGSTPILLPPPSTSPQNGAEQLGISTASTSRFTHGSASGLSSSSSYFSDTSTPDESADRGLAGLNNLGNTCFMNSSLQCLSHTPAVVAYFLTNAYRADVNLDNPLGMNGELAEAFGSLIHLLWQGKTGSVSPRGFKARLAHFAPQFSGYSQQDSQELLAFLLDGLHEDLNRIKKKPYIEEKDSDGRPDEVVAAEAWQNYRQRNDSTVVDHFQGLYKSCLVCPTCGHSSVKFDPFMYLSLQLPYAAKRTLNVTLVATDGSCPPMQYRLQVPKSGIMDDVQAALRNVAPIGEDEDVVFATTVMNRIDRKCEGSDEIRLIPTYNPNIMAYRRPGTFKGCMPSEVIEVHVLHRRARNGTYSSLYAAPLLLWFPASAINSEVNQKAMQGAAETADQQQQEDDEFAQALQAAVIQALRPFQLKGRRRPSLMTDMEPTESSGCKDGSTSTMAIDPSPLNPSTGAAVCMDSAGDEGTSRLGQSPVPMEDDRTHGSSAARVLVQASEPGDSTGPKVEPFDMWAGAAIAAQEAPQEVCMESAHSVDSSGLATPVSSAGPHLGPRSARKRVVSELQHLRPCNEFGMAASSAGDWACGGPLYFLLDWGSDDSGVYDPDLLEHPNLDESCKGVEPEESARISLDSCLEGFLQHEKLDPQDSWYCPKCRDHVQADKKLDLWSLPEVLVVHLKRFSYTSRLRDKLTAQVDFPLEGLDLSEHVLREQGVPPVYDLFAVSNHMGGLGGGHYTAYAKQPGTENWYCFDDSRVYPVKDVSQVVSSSAYVLFYQRRNEAHQRDEQVLQALQQDLEG